MLTGGPWINAVIADGGTESGEVDLGKDYRGLAIIIPTISTAEISVKVAEVSGGTFQPVHFLKEAGGSALQKTTSGSGSITVTAYIGGFHFIKIVASAAQSGAKTFRVRGINT